MIKRNLPVSEYGEVLEYTDEERKAIKDYTGEAYKVINSLLANDGGNYEKTIAVRDNFGRAVSFSETDLENRKNHFLKSVEGFMTDIPSMYMAMLKSQTIANGQSSTIFLHRGTSQKEALAYTRGATINKMLSTSSSYDDRDSNWIDFALANPDAAYVRVKLESNSRCSNYRIIRYTRLWFKLGKRSFSIPFY